MQGGWGQASAARPWCKLPGPRPCPTTPRHYTGLHVANNNAPSNKKMTILCNKSCAANQRILRGESLAQEASQESCGAHSGNRSEHVLEPHGRVRHSGIRADTARGSVLGELRDTSRSRSQILLDQRQRVESARYKIHFFWGPEPDPEK